jgi:hypothetical protein
VHIVSYRPPGSPAARVRVLTADRLEPYALSIGLTLFRAHEVAWSVTASTTQLHRRYDELVSCLLHSDMQPDDVILSRGTQNSCRASDTGFYPRRSCAFASSIWSWSGRSILARATSHGLFIDGWNERCQPFT